MWRPAPSEPQPFRARARPFGRDSLAPTSRARRLIVASTQTNVATPIDGVADAMCELVRGASVELTPRQVAAVPNLADHLPYGTRVYVPFVPGADWQDTVRACERVHAGGMIAVPHLAARFVADAAELDDRLRGLAEVSVTELMLVAGDRKRPQGVFRDTLDILDSGRLIEHGMVRIGIAGYPEGHPLVDPDLMDAALARKREYAATTGTEMWMVSQFAFEPETVIDWLEVALGEDGAFPVRVGLAGPARLTTLMAFAARCGIGASASALIRRPGVLRLLNPRLAPDDMLDALARHRVASPDSPLSGIHLFTFGGLPQTSRWLRATAGVGTADVVDFQDVKAHGER